MHPFLLAVCPVGASLTYLELITIVILPVGEATYRVVFGGAPSGRDKKIVGAIRSI
jgi:hypothetical protein